MEITFEQLPRAVAGLYDELASIRHILAAKTDPEPQYDGMNPHQAIEWLSNNGYPVGSVQTLYGLVHKRQIPFAKRGKRLIFSRKELKVWLTENRIPTASERLGEVERSIAENKRR